MKRYSHITFINFIKFSILLSDSSELSKELHNEIVRTEILSHNILKIIAYHLVL